MWIKNHQSQPTIKIIRLKICCGRKSQLFVLCQVVTNPCCGLAVIFCSFISHVIGWLQINIPEIFSGVHGFTGKTTCITFLRILKLKRTLYTWLKFLSRYTCLYLVHIAVVFCNNSVSVLKQSLAQLAHALCDEKLDHSSLVQVFWPKSRFVCWVSYCYLLIFGYGQS